MTAHQPAQPLAAMSRHRRLQAICRRILELEGERLRVSGAEKFTVTIRLRQTRELYNRVVARAAQ